MLLIEVVAVISLAAWLGLLADRSRRWPIELDLSSKADGRPLVAANEVVALVPARNEEECIASTISSLLRQEDLDLSVLLIDDRSTDETVTVAMESARRAGQTDRLGVTRAGPTDDTHSGKVNALEWGLRQLRLQREQSGRSLPEWLLLTDADIDHRPGSVRDLLALASGGNSAEGYDLVSVMARLHAGGFWERLLIPPFVFFFQILYPFRRVARGSSSVAAAAGGCLLVRTESLERAGGFEAIRGAVIDDVALAQNIKRAGGRLWLGLDAGIRSLRTYPTLAGLWQMISRTAFTELRYSGFLLMVTTILLATVVMSPPLLVGYGVICWLVDPLGDSLIHLRTALLAGFAWLTMSFLLLPSVRHHRVPNWYCLSLPAAAVFYGCMTWSSAWRHWRGVGVVWRGRRIDTSSENVDS